MAIIQTVSGIDFDIININPENFRLGDIAHALSHINRFTGHTDYPYSVAQHSVMCARLVPSEYQLEALFHDAHEAYVSDVSAPLKALLPDYRDIEDNIEFALRTKLGLRASKSYVVHQADLTMLATERRDLMLSGNKTRWPSLDGIEPMSDFLFPWHAQHAKAEFIFLARRLLRENGVELCM